MKFSTRGRYGVRAMFVLAQNNGKGPLPLKQIAEAQGLSEPYLEQLIGDLRKAALVKSIRGAQGGYLLARTPKEITIGDIIRVMEGPIAPAECVMGEDECLKSEKCVTRLIWERVRDSVSHVLDSITLFDMLEDAEKIGGEAKKC